MSEKLAELGQTIVDALKGSVHDWTVTNGELTIRAASSSRSWT